MNKQINNIKLIICDVDGTLIGRDEVLSQKAVNLSNTLRESGYFFTIASGRTESMAEKYVRDLNIDIPYIASNGSTIASIGKTYLKNKISMKGLKNIIKESIDKGMTVVYTLEGKEYVINETDWIKRQREEFNRYHDVSDLSEEDLYSLNIDKLMIMDDLRDGKIEKLEEMAKSLSDEYGYTRYTNKSIEIINKNSSKAEALKSLAEILNIDLSEVLAIGDHINDMEMIEESGVGAAVSNAQEELKEIADYVSSKEEIDGVIEIVEKFLDIKVGEKN